MVPNGITHQVVTDDTEGVGAILDWLCLWLQIRHIDFTCWSQRKTDRERERDMDVYKCRCIQKESIGWQTVWR